MFDNSKKLLTKKLIFQGVVFMGLGVQMMLAVMIEIMVLASRASGCLFRHPNP